MSICSQRVVSSRAASGDDAVADRATGVATRTVDASKLFDLASQVEVAQGARSQFPQCLLAVVGAGLVGDDSDADLGSEAPALQTHQSTRLFEKSSCHILADRSSAGVLCVGSVETADQHPEIADVGAKNR